MLKNNCEDLSPCPWRPLPHRSPCSFFLPFHSFFFRSGPVNTIRQVIWRVPVPSVRVFAKEPSKEAPILSFGCIWMRCTGVRILGPFLRSATETDFSRQVRSVKRSRFAATVFVRSKPVNWVRILPKMFMFLTSVAGSNLLTEKVSRFSELSSEFEFWGSFSSNVTVNPVFSWKGQNPVQRIFPPYSQHFTTPLVALHDRRESLVALHDTLLESTPQSRGRNTVKWNSERRIPRKNSENRRLFSEQIWSCDRRNAGSRINFRTTFSDAHFQTWVQERDFKFCFTWYPTDIILCLWSGLISPRIRTFVENRFHGLFSKKKGSKSGGVPSFLSWSWVMYVSFIVLRLTYKISREPLSTTPGLRLLGLLEKQGRYCLSSTHF